MDNNLQLTFVDAGVSIFLETDLLRSSGYIVILL